MTDKIKNDKGFFNEADTAEGFEDINAKTIAIPFLRILQPLSPQLDKEKPEFIKEAEKGMFFNTVSQKVYSDELNLIILKFEHVYLEWKPNRGGLVDYHTPEHAAEIAYDTTTFGAWKTEAGNELIENYTYFCLVEGEENQGPVIFTFTSTAIKTAKKLNKVLTSQIMDNGKKALPYYLVVNFKAEYKTNDKGAWYIPVAEFEDYITKEQYEIVQPERLALPDKTVDYAQLEDTSTKTVSVDDNKAPY